MAQILQEWDFKLQNERTDEGPVMRLLPLDSYSDGCGTESKT